MGGNTGACVRDETGGTAVVFVKKQRVLRRVARVTSGCCLLTVSKQLAVSKQCRGACGHGWPELYNFTVYDQCCAHTASFKNGTVNNDRK